VRSISSLRRIYIDVALDSAQWPKSLNSKFSSVLEKALDKTRKLRRLSLVLDTDKVGASLKHEDIFGLTQASSNI
jgi:hypothetical protein